MQSTYVVVSCYACTLAVLIFFGVRLYIGVTRILKKQNSIILQNIKLMTLTDQINAALAGIGTDLTGIAGDITAIGGNIGTLSTNIAALIQSVQANPNAVDGTAILAALTPLQAQADAAKSGLDQAAANVAALVPASVAPATPAQSATPAAGTTN